jgi:RecA-family ATPase
MNPKLVTEFQPEPEVETGEPKKPISFRSPDEILAMPRNPHANFLGDRLLGIGQQLVIAGIGGIGKSLLLLRLLVAFILERAWCGIETHNTKDKPWMLIQTQNGTDRLQREFELLKKSVGCGWSLIEKNLKIHTLETDRDLMLHLSDPTNVVDLESAIREFNPIGVAYDPLIDFSIGDLSKDVDMTATCSVIGRVSRAGNPERAIIVVTHAITGLAGMKKAFGFEAAGFGRNSKVLQSWTRASINVVPATEDYSILVLTCGKSNMGKMFEPFAIRRTDEISFEPEPEFDIQAFREHIESPKKSRQTYSPQIVAEIDWPKRELDKKQLAAAIESETGCSKSTAYRLIDDAVMRCVIRFKKQTKIYAKNDSKFRTVST